MKKSILSVLLFVISFPLLGQIEVKYFNEESKRYQADLSFKIDATREEIQDYIDELIMSAF